MFYNISLSQCRIIYNDNFESFSFFLVNNQERFYQQRNKGANEKPDYLTRGQKNEKCITKKSKTHQFNKIKIKEIKK